MKWVQRKGSDENQQPGDAQPHLNGHLAQLLISGLVLPDSDSKEAGNRFSCLTL